MAGKERDYIISSLDRCCHLMPSPLSFILCLPLSPSAVFHLDIGRRRSKQRRERPTELHKHKGRPNTSARNINKQEENQASPDTIPYRSA